MVMKMLFFAIHLRKINSITIASQSQINRTNSAIAIAIINMTCDYLFCDCDSLKLPRCDAIAMRLGALLLTVGRLSPMLIF